MEDSIKSKLEELRGFLQADGGDMELVEIEGTNVKLRLTGACGGCPHATMTIKQGIERILSEQVDENIVVVFPKLSLNWAYSMSGSVPSEKVVCAEYALHVAPDIAESRDNNV